MEDQNHRRSAAFFLFLFLHGSTVKLGDKGRLDREKLGNSEPFPVTNLPAYLMNSEQPSFREQFCDDQKVPYHQVRMYS